MGLVTAQRQLLRRGAARAFTLIEIMVVLVVLGIAASVVVVRMAGDERRDIQREAKRLAGALEHAAAVAQWSGETLGISAEGNGYRFWRRDSNDQWNAYTGDEILAARALPSGLTVAPLSYAGAPVPNDAVLPFRASGRNEPYTLALASAGGSIIVSADPLNRVGFAPFTATQEAPTPNEVRMPQSDASSASSPPPPRDQGPPKNERPEPNQRR